MLLEKMTELLVKGLGEWMCDADQSSSDSEHGQDEPFEVPMVKTGISAGRRDSPLTEQERTEQSVVKAETFSGIGQITVLDMSRGKGVIDRLYQFDMDPVEGAFRQGDTVKFEAERSTSMPQWQVSCMKPIASEKKEDKQKTQIPYIVSARVKKVSGNRLEVVEGTGENDKSHWITIPSPSRSEERFTWMAGDWIKMSLEPCEGTNVTECADGIASLKFCIVRWIDPLEEKTFVGRITKRDEYFLVDDHVCITKNVCPFPPRLDQPVRCTAIKSTPHLPFKDEKPVVEWRAIEMGKSQFCHYPFSEESETSGDGGMFEDEQPSMRFLYNALLKDKSGVRILPRFRLEFPPSTIRSSETKQVVVVNGSKRRVRLEQIILVKVPSPSQFKIFQCQAVGGLTILPGESLQFDVKCTLSTIGQTSEICIFDFGSFLIGREFRATGLLKKESIGTSTIIVTKLPTYRKQIGERDISKVRENNDRRRVRGSHNVRDAFFAPCLLPLNQVPEDLLLLVQKQDETALREYCPEAFASITFTGYIKKLQLGLWFEEIEGDLRRRRFDLENVSLEKHSGHETFFTFNCPFLAHIRPSVHVLDTIDVFIADSPENARFQGTIIDITGTEVACVIGETFNALYNGSPLNIQFKLGRTIYKRYHYAVQRAWECLGEAFLFPADDIIAKEPLIAVDENECEDQGSAPMNQVQPASPCKTNHSEKISGGFIKTPALMTIENAASANHLSPSALLSREARTGQTPTATGKRAISYRETFVSDTTGTPSIKSTKMKWFNTALNSEQRNAVCRIMMGEARPTPYIIFGPPGTGKTITIVEAVMQINKLDTNSRVLVCAPSNAAADVIASYLIKSNHYKPGDFVRFNGFHHAGKNPPDLLSPFCCDGENLKQVAKRRLIISTCTTAGQLVSLGVKDHFTHVFIDEAGYCVEPEALLPTIMIATEGNGQLILAGDPKQLGPVVLSDVSQTVGLNQSFLARLMERPLYQRDTERFKESKYNPLVLTKLVKNYRSHRLLLELPSGMFYNDELVSEASCEDTQALCKDERINKILGCNSRPLIFHGIQGTSTRDHDCPSWYNIAEAELVAAYVEALVKAGGVHFDDIGIITYYRKQVEQIRMALQKSTKYAKPKVASVEEFQGCERRVIIISTVRSVSEEKVNKMVKRLDFIFNPNRFNVAITRAHALLIVIGNPNVLAKNKHWLQLLKQAIELNAYAGCNLPLSLNEELKKWLTHPSVILHSAGDRPRKDQFSSVYQQMSAYDGSVQFQDCADDF